MSKKFGITVCIVSVLAICLSVAAIVVSSLPEKKETEEPPVYDTQYVLYLGTNDKDTNEPVFAPDVAKEKAIEILLEKFGGYTIQEANGGWIDGEKVYQEYTLVIYLSDTNLADVHTAADKMIEVFNQSSVLIQCNQTVTEFYSGKVIK